MAAGLTNYLRNKIVDWLLRGQSYTPPTNVYVELVSTTPSAAGAGTPLSGSGYARVGIACSTTAWAATNGDTTTTNPSSGTTGTTSNNAVVNFGTAAADWGTATHFELYDASTSGNRLLFGVIVDGAGNPSPRSIVNGDPVTFPISSLKIIWA